MTAELVRGASHVSMRLVAPAHHSDAETDRKQGWTIRRVPGPGRRMQILTLALAARQALGRADLGIGMHPLAALGFVGERKPFIVFTHGGELRSPRIRRVARIVLPRAARVICNSRYTRSEAIALGADPMRTEVIPPGAPEPRIADPAAVAAIRDRIATKRIVLCVARLVPHKGQDALIEAVAQLEDTHLVLIGTGPHEAKLRSLAHAKAADARTTFAGRVGDDELVAWYAAADAFAMCSSSISLGEQAGVEGAGIAILEAMSMRVPVVAAPTGGIPETVVDGVTGLLAPARDPSAIARALRRLFDDDALRDRLVDRAYQLVTTERSWTRFVERVEDVCILVAARTA